jgi:integrase
MPRTKKTRAANGRSSIYLSHADKSWHGYVTVGVKDNGKPDRRHVRGKTRAEVTSKVQGLEKARDQRRIRKAGETWTLEAWLTHWLNNIMAPPAITENAWDAYRNAVSVHLIPGLGAHRLDRLEPEHLENLYRKMIQAGSAPGNAHQVHRTIRAALNEAVLRKHIVENPAIIARAPKLEDTEVEPYSVVEVKRILESAQLGRNSARWAIALALGLRQGEALGLMWSDIDVAEGILIVRRNRLRPKWSHGCSGTCGHKHAGHCPERKALRPETGDTKSRAGKRAIGLPDQLLKMLKQHQQEQETERRTAAELWQETGYVFTDPTGNAINPRTDHKHWKKLLEEASVGDRRLHDARHTAATVLLLLKIPERTVMSIMGWSNTAMAARYQHIIAAIRRDVASQVGGLLWKPTASSHQNIARRARRHTNPVRRRPAT